MQTITIYRFKQNRVYDCDVQIVVADSKKSPIPAGHTRQSPHPIPDGHHAVMQNGWKYVPGDAPEYKTPEPYIDPKLAGIEINGIQCSATRNDQDGLTAVAMAVTLARMAGKVFPPTVFYFDNGNSMQITDDNFDSIYSQWVPFRQSFFAA